MPARRSPCAWSRDTVPSTAGLRGDLDRRRQSARRSGRTCSSRWSSASRCGQSRHPACAPAPKRPPRCSPRSTTPVSAARYRAALARQLPARPRSARPSRRRARRARPGVAAAGPAARRPRRWPTASRRAPRFEEAGGGLPAWLVPGDAADERAALIETFTDWARWYRAEVSPLAGGDDAWVGERLEYRFRSGPAPPCWPRPPTAAATSTGTASTPRRPGSLNEPADAPDQRAGPRSAGARAAGQPAALPGHAVPIGSGRWRTRRSISGSIEAEPWDLARLLVAEFALTYGNDWLVVPVDVPFGSLTSRSSR